MQETVSHRAAAGTVLDAPLELAQALERVREHPGAVEITVGPDRPVGVHLGSVVKRRAGEQLREAGAHPLILRAPVALDEDMPDEGVIATVDEALSVAAGVGAQYLELALGGVQHRGRQRQRLYSMLAALAEAASAHGVGFLVQNETSVDEVLMLLVLLDRDHDHGTLDVASPEGISMAWDVCRSRAAGQPDPQAWDIVSRASERAPVLVRGLEDGECARLQHQLPGFTEALEEARLMVVEHRD